jgi:hypothetical protein
MNRWSISLTAAAVLAATAGTASADSPQSYLHTLAAPVPCAGPGGTPDATVSVCQGMIFGGTRVTLTSQAVIVAIGDAESSQIDCNASFDTTTHSIAVDGQGVPITVSPCRYYPSADTRVSPFFRGTWAVGYRYLIDPGALAPGAHTLTWVTRWIEDFTYSLGCTDPSGRCTVPAGSVEIETGALIVE